MKEMRERKRLRKIVRVRVLKSMNRRKVYGGKSAGGSEGEGEGKGKGQRVGQVEWSGRGR